MYIELILIKISLPNTFFENFLIWLYKFSNNWKMIWNNESVLLF